MNLVIPTAPVCDTAEKINPLVLLLASIAGVYIVSGVRSTEVK
ncbi:virulence factor TspB C-terminal domain-related protein [Nitrosomonas ureae]|nr:virulence factor TspB C-terminal domain-related protein [Nitrosomonas ureae]